MNRDNIIGSERNARKANNRVTSSIMPGMKLRRGRSEINRIFPNKGQRKKQKPNRAANDNQSIPSSSECGLDEIELSQSDVEEGGNKGLSSLSDGTEEGDSQITISQGLNKETAAVGPLVELGENRTPLSHRRSERSKARQPQSVSLSPDRSEPMNTQTENQSLHNRNNIVRSHSRDQQLPSNANNSSSNDFRSAHNAMKAEIMELKRDKRAYSSALVTLREKSEQMSKDMQMKNLQITALEEALSRKRNNGSGKKTIPWSLENLSKHGLARYQGICFAAGKYGTNLAKLVVSEMFIDEKDDFNQKQDWTPSATKVSTDTADKAVVFVKLPDGVCAIPVCNMVRALKLNFFSSRFNGSIGLLKASFLNVLEGPVGTYLSEAEREECLSRVSAHRPTIQKFRAIISDAVGNRKKAAKNMYLKSLGYKYAYMPESKKDTAVMKDLRTKEKEAVLTRCVSKDDENDTTFWRTSEWQSLCAVSLSDEIDNEMNVAEREIEQQGKVDNLFMNEAARRSFLVLCGCPVSSSIDDFSADTSMLHLARADASMTTMLKYINVGGKGGSRNDNFVESFRELLPKALAVVIKDIWCDLELSAPHELNLYMGNSSEDETDPHGNNIRDWTVVQKNPDDNYTYLLASPKYFRVKVCSWYGTVKDGHIGRYDSHRKEFVMITSTLSSHAFEESDIEEEAVGGAGIDGNSS